MLCLPVLLGLAAPAAAQTNPTITPSTLIETGVANSPGTVTAVTVSNIPSDWTAPVNHSLTTTGTGTGHATIGSICFVSDAVNRSLDAYDVCDDQGTGYDSIGNRYYLRLRASIDSHDDSGETFTVTLTDSSATPKTVSFTMTINDPPVRIGVSLPDQEGVSRVDGKQLHVESTGSVAFPLSADEPLANNLTVCVRVSEEGGNRVTSGEGIQTVTLLASGTSNGSGTHTVTWTDTAADDPNSTVIVRVVSPDTLGCSATDGSYAVSGDDPFDTILIQDDEDTTVSLTSTDVTMTEGDASDTATLTISLDRRLYAGETIGVPIALASTTGARLPGSVDGGSTANHDFEVTAAAASMHSGVTLANALTANPRVVFTGHGTNTVQTATVTLTPVANRDDGDAAHETITATLASLGLVDTVAFHRPYKRLGVEKGDELRVAGVDHRTGTVNLEGADGQSVAWEPNRIAARAGGVEVYRGEEIELRAGDRIRWTRNDAGLGLVNSGTAEVAAVRGGHVTFRLEDGRSLDLAPGDPQLRHLDRAWASTVHAFQGRTVDTVIAAMEANHPHLTTQKSFYVEISRARDRAELVTDDRAALKEQLEAATGERIAALEAVGPEKAKGQEAGLEAGRSAGRESGASVSQERDRTPEPEIEGIRAPKGMDRDLGL